MPKGWRGAGALVEVRKQGQPCECRRLKGMQVVEEQSLRTVLKQPAELVNNAADGDVRTGGPSGSWIAAGRHRRPAIFSGVEQPL
eukprot:CAMPEP_0176456222 /NCGR_PEP_ID=MMETSP0127-20121128/31154_1 /TAXON_ID=938130 /ORGANISM="Platyophrya macrostoma, Strain WH" /LENGTH=84 /DNA_ID=CAMNT_0017846129 /DNA_START=54 /DNA_END=308 /DNA_ORIENTATION=+